MCGRRHRVVGLSNGRGNRFRCSVLARSGLEGATVRWRGYASLSESDTGPVSGDVNGLPDDGLLRSGLIADRVRTAGTEPSEPCPTFACCFARLQLCHRRYQSACGETRLDLYRGRRGEEDLENRTRHGGSSELGYRTWAAGSGRR